MNKLHNYIQGAWTPGQGEGKPLYNAVTGDIITHATTEGLDFGSILAYGREKGGKALGKMTFQERGLMLKALALYLHERRKSFYPLSYQTGATKVDSWIDIEGGIGNLFAAGNLLIGPDIWEGPSMMAQPSAYSFIGLTIKSCSSWEQVTPSAII